MNTVNKQLKSEKRIEFNSKDEVIGYLVVVFLFDAKSNVVPKIVLREFDQKQMQELSQDERLAILVVSFVYTALLVNRANGDLLIENAHRIGNLIDSIHKNGGTFIPADLLNGDAISAEIAKDRGFQRTVIDINKQKDEI